MKKGSFPDDGREKENFRRFKYLGIRSGEEGRRLIGWAGEPGSRELTEENPQEGRPLLQKSGWIWENSTINK